MNDETLQRLASTHDRQRLEAETEHGASYPVRLQARVRLAELAERRSSNRERLMLWRNEVEAALGTVDERASFEFSTLGDVERWVRSQSRSAPVLSQSAMKSIARSHPDLQLLDALAMLFNKTSRDRLPTIRSIYERRFREIMPRSKHPWIRSDQFARVSGGEFDGSAIADAVKAALDEHVNELVRTLTERYVESSRAELMGELARIDQQLEAAEHAVAWGDPQWEEQSVSTVAAAAAAAERQAAPLCLEDSPFLDHLLYFETKPRRARRRVGVIRPSDFANNRNEWKHFSGLFNLAREEWPAFEQLMFSRIVFPNGTFAAEPVKEAIAQHLPERAGEPFADAYVERLKPYHEDANQMMTRIEWIDEGPVRFGAFAEVGPTKDARLRDRLLEAGATVEPHVLEIPIYRSWAKVEPGHVLRATLETDHGPVDVAYLPHAAVGGVRERLYDHVLTLRVAGLGELLVKSYEQDVQFATADSFLALTRKGSTESKLVYQPGLRAFERMCLQEAVQFGRAVQFSSGQFAAGTVTARTVDASEIDADPMWERVGDDRWLPREIDSALEYDLCHASDYLQQRDHLLRAADRLKCDVRVDGAESADFVWALENRQWRGSNIHRLRNALWDAPALTGRMLYDAVVESIRSAARAADIEWRTLVHLLRPEHFNHSVAERIETREVVQEAPFSERGIIRFDGEADAIVAAIAQLGFGRVARWVPRGWLGGRFARGERVGRVSPIHVEYASGERSVDLQPGVSIIHGLTGTKRPVDALDRLDSIIASGGIKSIAERRRMQLAMHTMSPLGDIASGIDAGVPCKIGVSPSYGEWVFFTMKPDVLARRDAWFADRDFGGGRCRYDLYTRYAERIGQRRIYDAAPADARERHLRESHDRSHNEIWLKHEISWDEIDALFVCDYDGLVEQVRSRVEQGQAEGRLPKDLVVIPYPANDRDNRVLTDRMRARARARQGLRHRETPPERVSPVELPSFDVGRVIKSLSMPEFRVTIIEELERAGVGEEDRRRAEEPLVSEYVPNPFQLSDDVF